MEFQFKGIFLRLFRSALSILIIALAAPSSYAADVANGNGCVAANLAQAMELKWDHARVSNPVSNPSERFVTCTLTTGQKYLNPTGLDITTSESGGVTAVFLSGAAADSEVSCIFREMGNKSTSLVATDSKSVVLEAPDTIPGFVNGAYIAADNLSLGSFIVFGGGASTVRSLTVTCKLDPGTGINAYWANQTLPTP